MATGTVILDVASATPPDGSTGNAGPSLGRVIGTESNPKKFYLTAAFDPGTDEHLWWNFRMPADYASGGTIKILWYSNDTGASETCVWGARLGAVTPADADTPIEHAEAAATTTSTDVNTTEANRLIETSITLANLDSVAAGDLVFIVIYRDADNGSDDLTSDALLVTASFEYTTS